MVIRKLAALGVVVSALMVAGCGTQEGNAAGEGEGGVLKRSPPQLVIFVYDRSTSISHHQLELARQLTNATSCFSSLLRSRHSAGQRRCRNVSLPNRR